MYLRAAKTEAQEAGEETEGMANSISKLRSEIKTLTKGQVDIMANDNTYKSTYQILQEMSKIWDKLADVDQARLLEIMGGKRNANVLSSILMNFDVAEQSLETSLNSAGSAMAENDKYLDSIQGRLDQLSATFEKLSTQVLSSGAVKGFITILRDALTFLTAILGLGNGTVAMFLGLLSAITAIVKVSKMISPDFVKTIKLMMEGSKFGSFAAKHWLALAAAIAAVVAAISLLSESIKRINERIRQNNEEIATNEDKMSDIIAQLKENESIRTRILKLQAAGLDTAEDRAKLKAIEDQNAAYEVQLQQLRERQKILKEQALEDWNKFATNGPTNTAFTDLSVFGKIAYTLGWDSLVHIPSQREKYKNAIDQWRESIKSFSYTENPTSPDEKAINEAIRYSTVKILDLYKRLGSHEAIVTELKNYAGFESLLKASSQEASQMTSELKQLAYWAKEFGVVGEDLSNMDIWRLFTGNKQSKTALDVWSTQFGAEYFRLLSAYRKSGLFGSEKKDFYESFNSEEMAALISKAKELGIISEDISEEWAAINKIFEALKFFSLPDIKKESFAEMVDLWEDSFKTLSKAQEEVNKNGSISIDTIIEMENSGLLDYLMRTENGFVLVDNAFETYISLYRAPYESAVQSAYQSAQTLIYAQQGVAASYAATEEELLSYMKALRSQERAAYQAATLPKAKIEQIWGGTPIGDMLLNEEWTKTTVWDDAIKSLENALANRKQFDDIWKQYQKDLGTSGSSGSGSAKTPGERAADAWKTRLNEQKHLLQMGIITEKEYYKWLSDNYRKDLGDYADNLDERRSLDEDYYNWLKNQYKKDLDDQKKALQDRQNELKEFYDKQKKMVEDAYDKEEEENERAEYAKEIARLDTLIARLSLDTTQEAKRRLAEAEDDLAKQRKEYEDWEKGNAKDAILEALDEQYEAENKAIEDQVNNIDSTVENLDSTTSAIYDVISQWAQDKGYAVPQYARGTSSSFGGGAITQERASELIGMNVGSGRFTMLSPNSKVWSGAATDVLYRFANAPGSFIASLMARIGGTRGGQNMVAMGDIVINGNADSGTVAALRRERSALVYQVLSELKKLK